MSLHQDHDELFRTFATCVRSKAEICNLTKVRECEWGKPNVIYTECNEPLKVNAVQTQYGDCDFLQQDNQLLSLHASKSIRLNNIMFNKYTLHKAKATVDHPHLSIKIVKCGTNKSVCLSALADTSAQSNL